MVFSANYDLADDIPMLHSCDRCEDRFTINEMTYIDGMFLCFECAEAMGYVQCAWCGQWRPAVECYDQDGLHYCVAENCFEQSEGDDA